MQGYGRSLHPTAEAGTEEMSESDMPTKRIKLIKRIKCINNIGTFSNSKNSEYEFGKVTILYGLNTYGKTTLIDIFQSWKDADPSILQKRKTISEQSHGRKQEVCITYKDELNDREEEVHFENDNWSDSSVAQQLEIFGSDFIHKNLFTGYNMEHKNKEQFTQFVLGEDAKYAEEISALKSKRTKRTNELPQLMPMFVRNADKQTQEYFLHLNVEELKKENINQQIHDLETKKRTLEKNMKEPSIIRQMPEMKFSPPDIEVLDCLRKITDLLSAGYANIQDDAQNKINEHIRTNFKTQANAKQWIKDGLTFSHHDIETDSCAFCGQSLSKATELLTAYQSYFNEAYLQFIDRMETGLTEQAGKFSRLTYNIKSEAQTAHNIASKYESRISEEDFSSMLANFEEKISKIDEDAIRVAKEQLQKDITNKMAEKYQTPHKTIALDGKAQSEFETSIKNYQGFVNELVDLARKIRETISTYKKKYQDISNIKNEIAQLDEEIGVLKISQARIEQDGDCETYLAKQKEIEEISTEMTQKHQELQERQSDYLAKYYKEINHIFERIGSYDFELEKKSTMKGNMPVYSLGVKFRKTDIEKGEIETVFSESDRRALAFAVFWAKIKLKPDEERRRTIAILDDPVTSFDENRIRSTLALIQGAAQQLSQIIIATHYKDFVKRYCMINGEKTQIIELRKENINTTMHSQKCTYFTESEYVQQYNKIYAFIKGGNENMITELRPFIESCYLPTICIDKLHKAQSDGKDMPTLSKTIEVVFEGEDRKEKLLTIIKTLNHYHHQGLSSNIEDDRALARQTMKLLYPDINWTE